MGWKVVSIGSQRREGWTVVTMGVRGGQTVGWIIKMKNYMLLMALWNWDASWHNNLRTIFQNLKKKKLFLSTRKLIWKIIHYLYKVKNEVPKIAIYWSYCFSPQNSKTYGENGRSVDLLVPELWHFLHINWPFYRIQVNLNVKSAITQEPIELQTCHFHHMS